MCPERSRRVRYGPEWPPLAHISFFTNSDGIIELRLDYVKQLTNPILTFEKKQSANMFLEKLVEKHNLCLKYTGIEKSNSHCFNFQLKKCNQSNKIYQKRSECRLSKLICSG